MRPIIEHLQAKAWKNHVVNYTYVFMYALPKQTNIMEDMGKK